MSLKETKRLLDLFESQNGRKCQSDREFGAFVQHLENVSSTED